MNKILVQKTNEWMQLERKTLAQRKRADEYYDTQLMKLIEEDFIKRNKTKIIEPVDYIIVSVGTSYEPIVLSISLFKPQKILFLYTEVSKDILDKVVSYTGLKTSTYEKKKVSEVSPTDIYQEIKEAYISWGKPKRLYIDFTGGTKAMSAAAALAGAIVDVQMIYVASNDYLADFRKPRPGSEVIVYIENPISVFGDMEVEKADELFHEHNFSGAKEKYEVLKEMIPDPMRRQDLAFKYLLSAVYEEWDSLNFARANNLMNELVKQIKRDGRNYPNHPVVANSLQITKQAKALSNLSRIQELTERKKSKDILIDKDVVFPLMFTMYMNAVTRENQGKLDMSTLLFYRLLELVEQRRLASHNLFVFDMNYTDFTYEKGICPELIGLYERERVEWLRREVFEIRKGLFKGKVSEYLPNPVSLLDGFIILSALRDSIVFEAERDRLCILKQMRSKVFLRNNSIFAHGLGPVSENDYLKFKMFVIGLFKGLCYLEKVPFQENIEVYSWIRFEVEE
ncbi:MAG: TIGR02710 family CRISPR-associated protein [Butyrivibrio sp.]|nr:TIGR02710 family CRISPR-associated protein [Butyrivibrio sp.]